MYQVGIVTLREPTVRDLFIVLAGNTQPALVSLGARWYDRLLIRFGPERIINAVAVFFLSQVRTDTDTAGPPSKRKIKTNPQQELTDAVIAVGWNYGIAWTAAQALPVKVFTAYVKQIDRHRGIDLLAASAVVCLPHVKAIDRRRQLREWTRMVNPAARVNGSNGLLDLLRQAGKIE